MKNIKHIFLIVATIFCVTIPAFFLAACGGGSSNSSKITEIRVKVDDQEAYSSIGYISADYGITMSDIYGRVSLVAVYGNGTQKVINDENFTKEEMASLGETNEKYYVASMQEGPTNWTEITEPSPLDALNAGSYKIIFTIGNYECKLEIYIAKAAEQVNLSIAVVPNSSSSYSGISSYKFGCKKYKEYNPDEYTSDYKVYIYNNKTNEVVSGTAVKSVYAMPLTATEDYTFEWYDNFSEKTSYEVKVGESLLESYNKITAPDSVTKYRWQQEFIGKYAVSDITVHTNQGDVLRYDDKTLVVNTESVMPGRYYLVAYYDDDNFEGVYSAPSESKILEVKKGDFIWKNTLHRTGEDYNEDEVTTLINSIELSLVYKFNGTKFTTSSSKAISIDDLKEETIIIPELYSDNGWESFVVNGGNKGVFSQVEVELSGYKLSYNESTGKYERNGRVTSGLNGLDSSNNGIILEANVKMPDWLKEYFVTEDTTSIPVIVTFEKGTAYAPNFGSSSFEYNGKEQNFEIASPTENLFVVTGDKTATAVGDYSVIYKLKDAVNYEVYATGQYDDYVTGVAFDWEITKITLDEYEFTKEYTYNETTETTSSVTIEINYDPNYEPDENGKYRVTVMLISDRYNIIKEVVPDVKINFTLIDLETCDLKNPEIEVLGDNQFALTFTGSKSTSTYANIQITIDSTIVSNAYNPVNPVQIHIVKKAYTDDEINNIYGDKFVKKNNDNNYSADFTVSVDSETRIVPDNEYTNITTALGDWKVYYMVTNDSSNSLHAVTLGETVLPDDFFELVYVFEPNDDMYENIDSIYVDVNFVENN